MGNKINSLESWFNLIKNSILSRDKKDWAEIPNVGMFENMQFEVQGLDLDSKEITVKIKFDNWAEPESGKLMRDLADLIEPNFNLAMRLVDDPEHHYYSKFPQLHVHWDNDANNYESRITIDKGESDDVWVHSGHESFICKPVLGEVLHCLFAQVKKKQKESGKEFPNMPCENRK